MVDDKKINLEGFSREDYENLLHLVYLGNWMVNAIRHPKDEAEKYRQAKSKLLSYAKQFGLEDYAEYDEEADYFFASDKLAFNPEIERLRDEYDDEVFWGELVIRLTRRDFIQKYGRDKIEAMGPEEVIAKETQIEQKYWQEFQENGLDRLGIKE
jgi:hypothetical protein